MAAEAARGATRAIAALVRAGVPHELFEYDLAEAEGDGPLGLRAAEALGVPAETVFKTLVAVVGEEHVVVVVPVASSLDLRALAAAAGAKKARLADPAAAERVTGYVLGAISPFGLRRRLPMLVDATAEEHETVHVSAGKRGLELALSPADLVALTGATVTPLARR